jgi:hypothetical protein
MTSIRVWTGTNWYKTEQFLYSFDNNALWLTTLYQKWISEEWKNSDLITNSYSPYYERTKMLHQEWENNYWENLEKQEYVFSNGRIDCDAYAWDKDNWQAATDRQDVAVYFGNVAIFSDKATAISIRYSDVTSVTEPGEINEMPAFLTFPNPATEKINIAINPAWQTKNCQIELFNQSGQRVKSTEISLNSKPSTTSINVEDVPPGLYLLKLTSGKATSTRKVIICNR